jgi:hypothetical protein
VMGDVVMDSFSATSTTATSTIAGNLDVLGTLHATVSYTGDLIFANNFRFYEDPMPINDQLATGTQSLKLTNQRGEDIFSIDEYGNLKIAGSITSSSTASTTSSTSDVGAPLTSDVWTEGWGALLDWFKDKILVVKEFFAEKITANELCVGGTCVNESQLKELLDKNGINVSPPPETPATSTPDVSEQTPPAPTEASGDIQVPDSTTVVESTIPTDLPAEPVPPL